MKVWQYATLVLPDVFSWISSHFKIATFFHSQYRNECLSIISWDHILLILRLPYNHLLRILVGALLTEVDSSSCQLFSCFTKKNEVQFTDFILTKNHRVIQHWKKLFHADHLTKLVPFACTTWMMQYNLWNVTLLCNPIVVLQLFFSCLMTFFQNETSREWECSFSLGWVLI